MMYGMMYGLYLMFTLSQEGSNALFTYTKAISQCYPGSQKDLSKLQSVYGEVREGWGHDQWARCIFWDYFHFYEA